jgi:hypothetical protein
LVYLLVFPILAIDRGKQDIMLCISLKCMNLYLIRKYALIPYYLYKVLTQEYFGEHKVKQRTLFQRALIIIRRGIRFCHLAIKFLPLMLTLPIALLFRKLLYKRWLNLMIYTLENVIYTLLRLILGRTLMD